MEYDALKGLRHSEALVVEHKDTAAVYGSGALEVFATPAMIALMEKTCLESVSDKIGEGNTTVGIAVNIKHLKASPVGSTIRCEAELVEVDRRRLKNPMRYTYRTQGTCSQAIEFEIEDGILKNVQFYGGCNGNTQGVATLVDGMKAEDVVAKLEGIRCGFKGTSCPDQLAKAIKQALAQE